jgi:hypothetical protein
MTRFAARLIGLSILLSVVVNNPVLVSGIADQAKTTLTGVFATVRGGQPVAVERAPVQSFAGEVRFSATHAGKPVIWNTCSIVPVLVNPGSTGEKGLNVVKRAVAKLRDVTGVRFVVTGTSDVVPTTDWYRLGGTDGADGFAPVIVAFVDRDATDMLAKNAVGSAVANPTGSGHDRRLVTGAVVIAEDALDDLESGFKSGASVGGVLLHELGHLAGLDHAPHGLMGTNLDEEINPSYSVAIKGAFKPLRPVC